MTPRLFGLGQVFPCTPGIRQTSRELNGLEVVPVTLSPLAGHP